MTRVKICGITNADDALMCVRFGADELGFNFYEKSSRYISPDDAAAIVRQLPAGINRVGVFVNASIEQILETVRATTLDSIQLHGDEDPDFAASLNDQTDAAIIKAFRTSPQFVPD